MSNCNCIPCNPCETCDDDTEALSIETIPSKQCDTDCCWWCWKGCKDNCWINIQSTNDCLTVDTSECWIVKLTAECPKPTYVEAWENITVEEVYPPSDCYMDWGDCWIKGWWRISTTDTKVKACSWDTTPWTLDQKLEAGTWITINPIGCDGQNAKLRIDFDDSVLPACPEIPNITVTDNSDLVNVTASWHHITVTDNYQKAYYAKLVLAANHIWQVWGWQEWVWEKYLWEKSAVSWKPARQSWGSIDVRNSLLQWLRFFNWTASAPWLWWIQATRRWLYQVGFTWSCEFSYWVHAFRVQLYRVPASNPNAANTIVESRYSWPLGYEPWQTVAWGWGNIKLPQYISNIYLRSDDTVSSYTQTSFEHHLDYPLIAEKTEVEGQAGIGYSASLWAVMDRVTVTGNTIVELDVWDLLYVWLKVSTSITHSWDMMNRIPSNFKAGHIALLWADVESWDNWPEAWFSFYANLIHPITR